MTVICDIPCSCRVTEDYLGQTVCRRCRGDWYGCDCPTGHAAHCTEPEAIADFVDEIVALLVAIAIQIESTLEECAWEYYHESKPVLGETQAALEATTSKALATAHLAYAMARCGVQWSPGQDYPIDAADFDHMGSDSLDPDYDPILAEEPF